jgi:hypothetical protein
MEKTTSNNPMILLTFGVQKVAENTMITRARKKGGFN